jgi:hypothetical protein
VAWTSPLPAFLVLLALAGCAETPPVPPPPPPAGPWTPLFDGMTLEGWTPDAGCPWKVEGNSLVAGAGFEGRSVGEGRLATRKVLGDLLLSLRYRWTPGAAAAISLGGRPPDPAIEVIIGDGPDGGSGAIRGLAPATRGLDRPDAWNVLLAEVRGDRVWTWVNGTAAAEARGAGPLRGSLGLGAPAGPAGAAVEIRELFVREIAARRD